jgi:glycine/D-amino acid oxidase-like deaminating enzyme
MRGRDHATRAYLAGRDAIEALAQLAARLTTGAGFARKKSLYLASKRRDRQSLRQEFDLRRAAGLRLDWLEPSDITQRFSFRRPAALLSHDAGEVDPYALAHALLRDGCRQGLRVFDRTEVTRIEPTRDGVRLRTADGCRIGARRLVFATGYETDAVPKRNVARLVSTYAVASEPVVSFEGWGEGRCVIWEHARPYLYLRTTADRRVIVGGEDARFRSPIARDRLIRPKAARLTERFRDLFPAIAFEPAFAWTGTFGETADGLPYIGEHSDWPHAYFALCYGGNGITFGLLAAEIIRDAILDHPNANADLFRFDRDR